MSLDVLVPQDLQGDVLALQLAVGRRPVRLGATRWPCFLPTAVKSCASSAASVPEEPIVHRCFDLYACTLLKSDEGQESLPDIAPPDPALLAALRTRGRMRLTVTIAPEGIAELARLGWLARRDCRDPAAMADAVVSLADAALDTGLRAGATGR
jgi:hypothetical protein